MSPSSFRFWEPPIDSSGKDSEVTLTQEAKRLQTLCALQEVASSLSRIKGQQRGPEKNDMENEDLEFIGNLRVELANSQLPGNDTNRRRRSTDHEQQQSRKKHKSTRNGNDYRVSDEIKDVASKPNMNTMEETPSERQSSVSSLSSVPENDSDEDELLGLNVDLQINAFSKSVHGLQETQKYSSSSESLSSVPDDISSGDILEKCETHSSAQIWSECNYRVSAYTKKSSNAESPDEESEDGQLESSSEPLSPVPDNGSSDYDDIMGLDVSFENRLSTGISSETSYDPMHSLAHGPEKKATLDKNDDTRAGRLMESSSAEPLSPVPDDFFDGIDTDFFGLGIDSENRALPIAKHESLSPCQGLQYQRTMDMKPLDWIAELAESKKAPYSITEVDKGLVSALEAYYIELHKGKDRADSARAAVYRFNEVLVPSERSIFPYFESTFDKVVLIFEQTKGNPVIHITQVVERYLYIMRCKQRAEVLMQQVDDAAELLLEQRLRIEAVIAYYQAMAELKSLEEAKVSAVEAYNRAIFAERLDPEAADDLSSVTCWVLNDENESMGNLISM